MPAAVSTPATTRMYQRVFWARPDQVREARRFLQGILAGWPVSDDAVLCASELASNSVVHSASRQPGGTFTVSAEISQEDHVRVEVRDAGGRWNRRADGEGRPHGLDIARALAADFGIAGDALTGWIVWARFDWPERSTS
jgi:anti-sigma regulatory factor (Ser/Thr protein kinase)